MQERYARVKGERIEEEQPPCPADTSLDRAFVRGQARPDEDDLTTRASDGDVSGHTRISCLGHPLQAQALYRRQSNRLS